MHKLNIFQFPPHDDSLMDDFLASASITSYVADAVNNFVFYGLSPGNFTYAILTNNLKQAVLSTDTHNKEIIADIVLVINYYLPPEAWGSVDAYTNWQKDINGIRTAFTEQYKKKLMWEVLSEYD